MLPHLLKLLHVHYLDDQLKDYPTDPEYGATSVDAVTKAQNDRLDLFVTIVEGIDQIIPEAQVINKVNPNNPNSPHAVQNRKFKELSYVLGKNVVITDTDQDSLIAQGLVVDTEIGNGISIQEEDGAIQDVVLFDTHTKVRIAA